MINLRDYQIEMIGGCQDAMRRRVKRILLQAPTGAGKTVLASFMARTTATKGGSVWFVCHRAELVLQTSLTFRKFGIAHAFIAAGYPMSLRELVQVCSIDTLKNRLSSLAAPKVAIIDEAHHGGAAGWALVIKWLHDSGSYVIGLSATPQRHDGQGLDAHFDEMVLGPSVAWLMEHGNLSRYEAFIPDIPDMKGVKRYMGDFSKSETAEKMDKPKLTGNIIKHWRKYADGVRTVGFGVNVAHSQHLTESFRQAGIPAAHLDGGTDKAERKRVIQGYAAGDIRVLFNVSLFGEGFDLSAIAQTDVTIDCLIDAAPTQSLSLAMQRWGRVLRPAPGKVAVILDHAGNMMRHGFPDDEREWSLDGREKGRAANDNGPPPPVICEGCFNAIKRPLPPECPHCGKSLQAKAKEIEVAEGELRAVDEAAKAAVRAKLKRELDNAKDVGAMAAIYAREGERNPMGRAVAEFGSRRFKRR
jgi:superfamily II DNA or RNA helicase